MLNNEVNYSLICAVREGRLERVRELVNSFGLSYSPGWSEGYTLLCDAIKNERLEIVKFLLEHGAKVKSNNNNVNTPLHFAVSKEYSDIIETLLNRGAYVDAQNKEKQTSLYLAVQKSNETIVRLLLGRGASTCLINSWGDSLLHIACSRQSNLNIVELLINHGAYVNCSTLRSCDTPLHLAAREKNEKLVLLLLDRGAHLEATNSSGNTPLHCAVESGSQEFIKLLLDKKANVNAISNNKSTPLHLALQRRDEKIAKLLLEYGANVNTKDKYNKTPLCLAVERGFSSLIKEILQHNPDVSNKLALKAAVCGYGEKYNEIFNSLMKYGITFNHEDIKDSELLHTAVKKGYFKIVECLLNHGADSNSVHNGYTLLYNAIDSSHEEIVNLLLNHGADSNTKCSTYHNTPIHYSIEKKHAGILKSLLDKPNDIPKLKRERVVKNIIRNSPEFEDLYSDYKQIRDIHSLERISNYVQLALSANPKEREGQLIIIRVLQSIGEYLKNTLESPKLSDTTSDLLLLSLPKGTREIVIDLRNSLSHSYSLARRMEIEENANVNFFSGVQSDTKKIGNVVTNILYKNKIKVIKQLVQKIIDSENFHEIKEVVEVFNNAGLMKTVSENFQMNEHKKLEKVIAELSTKINDETIYEKQLFDKIHKIIDSEKDKLKGVRDDYFMGFASLKSLSMDFHGNENDKNFIRQIKFHANQTLKNMSTKVEQHKLKDIAQLSMKILDSVSTRKKSDEIERLIREIFYIAEFEVNDLKWIEELKEKLNERTLLTYEDRQKKKTYANTKYNSHLEDKVSELKSILTKNKINDEITPILYGS